MALENEVQSLIGEVKRKMAFEEEEEEGFVIEGASGEEEIPDLTWALVGRFVTEKEVKLEVMQTTMGDLWKLGKGLFVKDLGQNRFLFCFFHEVDFQRAIEGGPRIFENALLVWRRVVQGVDWVSVPLVEVEFWVQIYYLIPGMRRKQAYEVTGNYVGKFVKEDDRNSEGGKKEYMRIRVLIDIRKPLKRKMKLKQPGGEWFWVDFKYERLPSFCFICGVIGHGERTCEVLYERPEFGSWLRASSKYNVPYNLPVSKWIRNSRGERLNGSGRVEMGGSVVAGGGGRRVDAAELTKGLTTSSNLNQGNQVVGGNLGVRINEKISGELKGVDRVMVSDSGRCLNVNLGGTNETVMEEANFQEEMEEGFVVSDSKRKRVEILNSNEGGIVKEGNGDGLIIKPSGPAVVDVPRVGATQQAHLPQ